MKLPLEVKSHTANYNEIRIKHELNWQEKQLKTILMNYKKAPFFEEVYDDVEYWFENTENKLDRFNASIIINISKKMGFQTEFRWSGDMNLTEKKTERLIDIIKRCGGNKYFSGFGGANYQDEERYQQEGISLIYTDFTYPQYPQLWKNFEKNLSILDLLFNCGYQESAKIISEAGK